MGADSDSAGAPAYRPALVILERGYDYLVEVAERYEAECMDATPERAEKIAGEALGLAVALINAVEDLRALAGRLGVLGAHFDPLNGARATLERRLGESQ